jgi:hypothetical protein
MLTSSSIDVDNRDAEEVYRYLEARIEVLKRRIVELETENAALRDCIGPSAAVLQHDASWSVACSR